MSGNYADIPPYTLTVHTRMTLPLPLPPYFTALAKVHP